MSALRTLWLGVGWLLCSTGQPAFAQVLRLEKKESPQPVAPTPDQQDQELRKDFRFDAAAETSPADRYQFWVPPLRREPGNAVAHILRANVMLHDIPNSQQIEREWDAKHAEWSDAPLSEFPIEEARTYLQNYRNVLNELAQAERVERIDYDFRIQETRGTAILSTLLPELQRARSFARLIKLEARLATAEGRYEDTIRSLRVGFRLGEIVSKMGNSFLIGKLVAIAINTIMLHEAEVLMQAKEAPNLYWALASLPAEIGDMRDALEGERLTLEKTIYRVMDLPEEEITEAAWHARIIGTAKDIPQLQSDSYWSEPDESDAKARLLAGLIVLIHGEPAKTYLREQGAAEDDVAAMTYSESTVRATRLQLINFLSEFYKWSLVPRSEVNVNQVSEQFLKDQLVENPTNPATVIAGLLLPAVQAAQAAGDRVLTKRNQLITLEAIRAHAATHDGHLPKSLDELTYLPSWKQAGTNEPFGYKRVSDTEAVLTRAPRYTQDHDAEIRLLLRPSEKR